MPTFWVFANCLALFPTYFLKFGVQLGGWSVEFHLDFPESNESFAFLADTPEEHRLLHIVCFAFCGDKRQTIMAHSTF
jgi:hypothetical protein